MGRRVVALGWREGGRAGKRVGGVWIQHHAFISHPSTLPPFHLTSTTLSLSLLSVTVIVTVIVTSSAREYASTYIEVHLINTLID